MFCILLPGSGLLGLAAVTAGAVATEVEELEVDAMVALLVLALLLLLLLLFSDAVFVVAVDDDFFMAARVAASDDVDDEEDEDEPFFVALDIAAFSFCKVAWI